MSVIARTKRDEKDCWKFTDLIVNDLMKPEADRLQLIINEIITANAMMAGKTAIGFTHQGIIYRHSTFKSGLVPQEARPTLSQELIPKFDQYAKDERIFKEDALLIKQVLSRVLFQAQGDQEMRDLLPDCMIRFAPKLQEVPRYMNRGAAAKNFCLPRTAEQYEKILPKIEMYAAFHLLF